MYLTFSLKYQLSNKKLLIEIFLMLLDGLSTNGLQKMILYMSDLLQNC